jgi:high-affinity Fe2+/Pb2+ permease
VRRINDAEAAASAAAIISQADQVKRAANSDKTLAKPDKEALMNDVDAVIKQAKVFQSRLKESKPATADARALVEKIGALTKESRQLPPPALTAIGGLRAPLDNIKQAFGLGEAGIQ